jgi:uncharacterized LabA/DUF88 family protein
VGAPMLTLTNTMKSGIFIDAGYLTKLLHIKNKKINLLKLSNELTNGTERIRTIYYDALPLPINPKGKELYPKAQRFHDALRKLDKFEVKLGRTQQIGIEFRQKGVDMRLGVDLVQMSMNKEIDKAILIASDSDFEYAVEKAQEVGVTVTLAYFTNSKINSKFLKIVNEKILLTDDLLDKCKL